MASIFQMIIAFFMSILAFFGINAGGGNQPAEEPTDVQEVVVVESGVKISLVSNASTGYTWICELDGDSVELTGERYISGDHGAMAGAPGLQEFTFTAKKAGTTTVNFKYLRTWENEEPAETYTAVITVDADMNVAVD